MAILVFCIVAAAVYAVTLFYPDWLVNVGLLDKTTDTRYWATAAIVVVSFMALLLIGAWVGWAKIRTSTSKRIPVF